MQRDQSDSQISCTDSTDRRLFECSNQELFLWCEVLHWFGVWSSTWTPSRWFKSHPTRLDGDFCRWNELGGLSSCLVLLCCITRLRSLHFVWPMFQNPKSKIRRKKKKEHQHNVVYHAKCPDQQCNSNYSQTKCRMHFFFGFVLFLRDKFWCFYHFLWAFWLKRKCTFHGNIYTNEKLNPFSDKICNFYVKRRKKKYFNWLKEVIFPQLFSCFECKYVLIALVNGKIK